jgi:hypothetical protein
MSGLCEKMHCPLPHFQKHVFKPRLFDRVAVEPNEVGQPVQDDSAVLGQQDLESIL